MQQLTIQEINDFITQLQNTISWAEYDYEQSTSIPGCRWPADAKNDKDIISNCEEIIKSLNELKELL